MRTHHFLAPTLGLFLALLIGAGCASDVGGASADQPPTGTTTTTTMPDLAPLNGPCGYCTVDGLELPPCPGRR